MKKETKATKTTKELTQRHLKELLHYDPETGIFTWKVPRQKIRKGDLAGHIHPNEHRYIGIDGAMYVASRLVWLYMYGHFPKNKIEHQDGVKWHNWLSNLKEVPYNWTLRNAGNSIKNKSGVKGVSIQKKSNKWRVDIMKGGKPKYLGLYEDFDEAVCVRLAAEQCLDWDKSCMPSPAYKYVQKMLYKEDAK